MTCPAENAVIIQARYGSSRLPGKVLEAIGGQLVLHHVLQRCMRIPGVGTVICAVPDLADSDAVANAARDAGAKVFRGAEQDVLGRYHGAAEAFGAKTVMRVTSDCPMLDPELCGQVLTALEQAGADYACNNDPPSFPHGLDCEVMTAAILKKAAGTATDPYDREHVTPWIRRSEEVRRAVIHGPGGTDQRWTLDYPEDLAFFRAVHERFGRLPLDFREGLSLLEENPDLAAINANRRAR